MVDTPFIKKISARQVAGFMKTLGFNFVNIQKAPVFCPNSKHFYAECYVEEKKYVYELIVWDFEISITPRTFIGNEPIDFAYIGKHLWISYMFSRFGSEYNDAYIQYETYKPGKRIW